MDAPIYGVTGAGGALEPSRIENGDIAATVSNQPAALQGARRAGHAHAAHAPAPRARGAIKRAAGATAADPSPA
jgi:hypothetical protein